MTNIDSIQVGKEMLSLVVASVPLVAAEGFLVSLLIVGGFFGAMVSFRIAKTIKQVNAFSQDHRQAKYQVSNLD